MEGEVPEPQPGHVVPRTREEFGRGQHLDDEEGDEGDTGAELDPEVPAGEVGAAEPTLPAEPEVADDRQVVRETDRPKARHTPGRRPDDAFIVRQPGD